MTAKPTSTVTAVSAPVPAVAPTPPAPTPAAPPPPTAPTGRSQAVVKPSASEAQVTQRVLADLQRQVELMLEVRLREALAPILARATDTLVRDARKELTAAMRDIVSRAIAKELGRPEDR